MVNGWYCASASFSTMRATMGSMRADSTMPRAIFG
jgi:hypothetical protein